MSSSFSKIEIEAIWAWWFITCTLFHNYINFIFSKSLSIQSLGPEAIEGKQTPKIV